MGVRESFSKLKKKLKHPLTRSKHTSDRTGADVEERVDATGSLPRPGPYIAVDGSYDHEDSGSTVVGGHVSSMNQPPQSSNGENAEPADLSPSTLPIPHGGDPDSM